jgi:4-hydroxybenzoate polyprenyltransferase
MNNTQAFLKLIRWNNLMILALMQIITAVFLVGPKSNWLQILGETNFIFLIFSTVFIAAGGYIINDYFDIKIDLMNKPDLVVIGRQISRRNAILSHQIFNFFGILLGFTISYQIGVINILSVGALWFYSERFKRQAFIGNLLVALLTFLSVFMVGLHFGRGRRIILIYALFAFVITLIREIIKDLEDIRGDARFGCKTLPILWGFRRTKAFILILIAIFVVELFVLSIPINSIILNIIFVFLLIPIFILTKKLIQADKKADFAWLSRFCKWIMLLGISTMLFYK